MNASFGIDHPLIAVNDIEDLRQRLISLGFNMTETGKHPWGTSTSLAMFNGCLLEIMGIYDDTLLDETPAGEFKFGRHIHTHLKSREGIALTALHSTNSVQDAKRAQAAGFTVSGHLEFGRDVTLPNGQEGRTKTTLALMPDPDWPRLSFFLCQQHRPDLIYVPEWLEHPNTVYTISGITIRAELKDHSALSQKLRGLYTEFQEIEGGFKVQTQNGPMWIKTAASIEAEFGALPEAVAAETQPSIVAMDFNYEDITRFNKWIKNSNLKHSKEKSTFTLLSAQDTGNAFLRFHKRQLAP